MSLLHHQEQKYFRLNGDGSQHSDISTTIPNILIQNESVKQIVEAEWKTEPETANRLAEVTLNG